MTDAQAVSLVEGAYPGLTVRILDACPSTNTYLKDRAARLPHGFTLLARSQSAGRGRMGRQFYSPEGTGLYMSVLLRPSLPAGDLTLITPAAAVAVRRAIEELSGEKARIKWVNDVLLRGYKVCGILTETAFRGGETDYVVLGVGVNVCPPREGFPEELRDVAGAVLRHFDPEARWSLAALILRHFFAIFEALPDRGFVEEYRRANTVLGREVDIISGGISRPAFVLDIDNDCSLRVRYPDGAEGTVSAGEVSVRERRPNP